MTPEPRPGSAPDARLGAVAGLLAATFRARRAVTATVLAGAALAATALAVTALAVTALAGAGPVLATGVGLPDGTGPTADAQVTGGAGSAWTAPDTALVILGADTVVAEVARTPDERARGLMFRTAVPDGTGMLFVFPEPSPHSFWMKDTFVALDIAYIDQNQRIVDILPMEPRTTEGYSSSGPALFALEVRQGWFAEHGVKVGDWADIRLPTTPR